MKRASIVVLFVTVLAMLASCGSTAPEGQRPSAGFNSPSMFSVLKLM